MAEILNMLNVSSVTDTKKRVGQLCKDAIVANSEHSRAFEFEQFSMTDHDFNKAFFWWTLLVEWRGMSWKQSQMMGSSSLFQSPQAIFSGIAEHIAANVATKWTMTWPDSFENFRCTTNSAMCCWVKHDETKGSEHFKRNTDLCFVPDIQSFAAGLFGQLQNFGQEPTLSFLLDVCCACGNNF
jgi:hypothetical protein